MNALPLPGAPRATLHRPLLALPFLFLTAAAVLRAQAPVDELAT